MKINQMGFDISIKMERLILLEYNIILVESKAPEIENAWNKKVRVWYIQCQVQSDFDIPTEFWEHAAVERESYYEFCTTYYGTTGDVWKIAVRTLLQLDKV